MAHLRAHAPSIYHGQRHCVLVWSNSCNRPPRNTKTANEMIWMMTTRALRATTDVTIAVDNDAATASSEAAPCPLQPCYFAKWDILADILDYQYVMGFPECIFDHFLPIFRIPCHRLMYERDCPIFQKLFFPKIRILVQLLFLSFYI